VSTLQPVATKGKNTKIFRNVGKFETSGTTEQSTWQNIQQHQNLQLFAFLQVMQLRWQERQR